MTPFHMIQKNVKKLLWVVSIHRPLGYEPNTLPLRHTAHVILLIALHNVAYINLKVRVSYQKPGKPARVQRCTKCLLWALIIMMF